MAREALVSYSPGACTRFNFFFIERKVHAPTRAPISWHSISRDRNCSRTCASSGERSIHEQAEYGTERDANHVVKRKVVTEQQAADARVTHVIEPRNVPRLSQFDRFGRDERGEEQLRSRCARPSEGEGKVKQRAPKHVSHVLAQKLGQTALA